MKNTGTLKVNASGEREVVMTRVFGAPREWVFEAWTKPEIVKHWHYGPDDFPLTRCEIDLRVGGVLRIEWAHRDGHRMGLSGVYRQIAPPGRLVFTETWDDDWTGGEAVVTITFSESAGKTTLTQTVLYSSRAARDAVMQTPMEHGAAVSYDRLAALLASGEFRARSFQEARR